MTEHKKIFISTLIISILTSLIIFNVAFKDISILEYFFVSILILSFIFINYSFENNKKLFNIISNIYLGNFLSYMFIYIKKNGTNILINSKLNFIINSEYSAIVNYNIIIILIIALVLLFLLLSTSEDDSLNKSRSKICEEKLIHKREKDLDRLIEYIQSFNIIGINAVWGAGKSFLLDKLKDKICNKYEIIEIDVLSCNLDEIQLIIIREIAKIIRKNRIFSRCSNMLQKFLNNQKNISQLVNIAFNQNYVYSDIVKGFQDEINKTGKKIIIIYEDIDRITNKKIIENILGISEKISNNNIKVLYQYEKDKLKKVGFDSEYLEKYISYEMNLTEIGFFEVIKFLFKEKGTYNNLNINDFDFLKNYNQEHRYNVLSEEFDINSEVYFDLSKISSNTSSIRRIKKYLNELNVLLNNDNYKNNKEIVIAFLFVKYFVHEVYEKININEKILDTLKFAVNSNLYTMSELVSEFNLKNIEKNEVKNAFKDIPNNNNVINYCVLKLFDYNITQSFQEKDFKKRIEGTEQEPVKKIQDRFENEKKDRIIWSLLENGKSSYTNYEYVEIKFIKEVLEKPKSERINRFREFDHNIFHQDNDEVDNQTIFLLGIPKFIELFKAFRILNAKNKYKIRLIDLYFDFCKVKNVDNELIKILNYCDITDESIYIHVITKFNRLKIINNLNKEKSLSDFLREYVRALSKLGYIDTRECFFIMSGEPIYKNERFVLEDINKVIKDLSELKDNIVNNIGYRGISIGHKLQKIISFFDTIIKLINCKKEADNKKDIIKVSYQESSEKSECKRLKLISDINFNKEVIKSYSENKMNLYEMNIIIEDVKKSKRKEFISIINKYNISQQEDESKQ